MALRAKFKETQFAVGDTVLVYQKIKEGDKMRRQVFEGVVIAIKGHGVGRTFIVRKIASGGIGVERIWPFNTPWISKIKVKTKGKVRRAKLYYLRKRIGKKALRVKKLDKETATLRAEEKNEGPEKKSQQSQETSVSLVLRKRSHAKDKSRKTRRGSCPKTSSK